MRDNFLMHLNIALFVSASKPHTCQVSR